MVSTEKIEELKQLYYKKYKVLLTDDEATEMATSLINLMKVLLKPDSKPQSQSNQSERKQDEAFTV